MEEEPLDSIIISAAVSWLYELEDEVIPDSGSAEERERSKEHAAKLRAALVKIGADV